jgi:hypothetical protein
MSKVRVASDSSGMGLNHFQYGRNGEPSATPPRSTVDGASNKLDFIVCDGTATPARTGDL